MCGDLAVSEATHSWLRESRGELGLGRGKLVWDSMPGLLESEGGGLLVVLEGSQASVCPGVSCCPRVSRYPRGPGDTCDFSPSVSWKQVF